jgi:hypothetical protein
MGAILSTESALTVLWSVGKTPAMLLFLDCRPATVNRGLLRLLAVGCLLK